MSSTDPAPASPKLYRQIAHQIEDAIRGGLYRVGERLPTERELTERFGVSRPTLREALIALELWGLVEARKGSGIYVISQGHKEPESEDVGAFELTEARVVIEGEVAAIAATSASPEQVEALAALLAIMADTAAPVEAAEAADRSFHILLAEATGNAALVGTVTSLWDWRDRSQLARLTLQRSRDAGSRPRVDDHRAVLDAVRAGDAKGARRAMRDHLANVIEVMLAATESDELEQVRFKVAQRRQQTALRLSV